MEIRSALPASGNNGENPSKPTLPRVTRRFWIQTLGLVWLFFYLCHSMAWSHSPAPVRSRPSVEIPESLKWVPRPLEDEQNAAIDWIRAQQEWVEPSPEIRDKLRALVSDHRFQLNAADRHSIQLWLSENRAALARIESSLSKPGARWPIQKKPEPEPALFNLIHSQWVLNFHFVEAVQSRDWNGALERIQQGLRLAELALDADGATLHFMVGATLQSAVNRSIQQLIWHHTLNESELVRLLALLPPLENLAELYERCLRVEFRDYVEKNQDAVELAEAWAEAFRVNPEASLVLVPESLHRVFRIFLDPSLVKRHPQPMDPNIALRRNIATFARYMHNVRNPWALRQPMPVDPEDLEEELLEDAASILQILENETLPLSRTAIERVQAAYLAFPDPVGRLFAAMPVMMEHSYHTVFRHRAEREILRALVGLHLYRATNRSFPESLNQVVQAGIFKRVPMDPFDGLPIRYSREEGVLWSIGEDEDDDEADGERTGNWYGFDYVLAIDKKFLPK